MDRESRYRRKVDSVIEEWRAGAIPDARELILKIPELREHRAASIDLAYEEYCLRKEAGQDIDTKEFCRKFPTIQHSLTRMLDVHRCLQSFAFQLPTDDATDWPQLDEQWLDWKLIDIIGRGSFSRVYLAEEPALGNRQVVVKCSHAGPKEAFILGRLAHENIVPVHSIRLDAGRGLTAICMPLLGRVTLAALLDDVLIGENFSPLQAKNDSIETPSRDNPFCLSARSPTQYIVKVIRLVEQLAEGLAAAHDRGIVHGDIKPSNILISFGGKPMLVDFNLAMDTGHDGQFGGTPPYMAPECFQCLACTDAALQGGVSPDERSDQFSLGVVLFELLTGRLPYELDFSDARPAYRDVRSNANSRKAIIPLESALLRILDRCLSTEPENRFSTTTILTDHLKAFRVAVERRHSRRRLFRRAVLGAFCLTTVGALGAAAFVARRESPSQRQLRSALQNMKTGDYFTAAKQLSALNRNHPSQGIAAWAAYCHAKSEAYSDARAFNGFALKSDDATGRIWTNLGYCNMQLGHLAEADQQFTRAIEKNPKLQTPFMHRARLQLRLAMQGNLPPNQSALADIKKALSIRPESADLHFLAASIYAYAESKGASIQRKSIDEHIFHALRLGEPAENFQKSHLFSEFDIRALAIAASSLHSGAHRAEILLTPPRPLESELPSLAGN
jgi:serine/threonine protein kinase